MLTEPLEERSILEIGCGIALPSLVVKQLGGNITASDYHPLAQAFLKKNTLNNSLAKIPYKFGDWNFPISNLGKFDLIVGSDLLYEPHHVELLSSFIDAHSSDHASIIIVDPGRGFHRKFARAMNHFGYSHTWTDLSIYSSKETKQKGFVFRFTRV